MLIRRFGLALAALGWLGCSAIINPDEGRFGGGDDAGSGRMDAGPGLDAGPGPDAGPGRDAGRSMCENEDPFCRGDGLVTCVGGFEQVQNCQAGRSYCESGECKPWECVPSSRECNGDRSAVILCNARGTDSDEVECPTGVCNPDSGSCDGVPPDRCMGLPSIGPGSNATINLCERPNDNTQMRQDECGMNPLAVAGDAVYRLEVTDPGRYVIELDDADAFRRIDTIVYLRRVCDEPGTQLGCDDYTPCSSTFPIPDDCRSGRNEGEASLDIFLEPGVYYIVADGFIYDFGEDRTSECGEVRLSVSRP